MSFNPECVDCSEVDPIAPVVPPVYDPPSGGLPAGGEPGQYLVIDDDGNPTWAAGGGGGGPTLYPSTGQSTTGGMTQKAITDELNGKATQASVTALQTEVSNKANQSAVDALTDAVVNKADQSAVNAALAQKANTSDVTSALATKADEAAVNQALANKVDKVTGKGLSTNDYTTADKTKLDDLADIKSIGSGLTLNANGELSATGGGGDSTFVAEYGVTTAQELLDYLATANEPYAPILVKRGNTYYTAVISTPGADRVNLSTFGTISGEGYLFNYTVTGANWSSSNIGFQTKLVSGMSIKTINGESILGSGNIDIQGGITVDDGLDRTSTNPVQNKAITEVVESMSVEFNLLKARIEALETALFGFEETRLQMTDGTNTVDKVVLTKPYVAPTPQTVFDLDDGVYAADGTFLGALTRGAETTNDIYETNDIIRTVNMTQIMTKYPTATGMVISGVTMGQNSVTGVTPGQLDWVCLKFSDEIYGPLAEHGTVPDWVSTIYVPATMESPFEPWGLTAATVNKIGTPLPWA